MKKITLFLTFLFLAIPALMRAQEEGTYYLYNEETQSFMERGADWGTQVTIGKFGLPVNISLSDSQCKLKMMGIDATKSQVKKPVPKFSELVTDGTTVQYLYNVEAGGFLLGANEWNTRASVSATKGYQFKIASTGEGTYSLTNYVETKSEWLKMFSGNATSIWVDNNSGANCNAWGIVPIDGTQTFQITNTASCANGVMACAPLLNDSRCYFVPTTTNIVTGNTWAAVSADDYAAWLKEMESYDAINLKQSTLIGTDITPAIGAICTSMDGWSISNSSTFHINTWSSEGTSDGSWMTISFLENWVASGSLLPEGTWSYTIKGLVPGQTYNVNAYVRAYNEGNTTAPSGAYLYANDGVSVDIATLNQTNNDTKAWCYGYLSADGVADSDGNLTVGLVLKNNNFNWIVMRDLTVKVASPTASQIGYNIYSDSTFTSLQTDTGYIFTNTNGYTLTIKDKKVVGVASGTGSAWQLKTQVERDSIIAARVASETKAAYDSAGLTYGSTYDMFDITNTLSSPTLCNTIEVWALDKERGSISTTELGTEVIQGNGSLTQSVKGLSAGLYKVSVNAMFRDGSNDDQVTFANAGYYNSNAYLSVNGNQVQITPWAKDRTDDTTPNNLSDFSNIVKNDPSKYLSEVYAYVGDDGLLNISLTFPAYNTDSWFIAKNVKITRAIDAESLASGNLSGDDCTLGWSLSNDGVLTISGKGAMSSSIIDASELPWYDYTDKIRMVIIKDSITTISPYAFQNCENLNMVVIPSDITTIGTNAFDGCSNIKYININIIDFSLSAYSLYTLLNTNFSDKTWTYYYKGKPFTEIPEGTKSIGNYVLAKYTGLTSITIPSAVTSIGSQAFYGCTNLTKLVYNAKNATISGSTSAIRTTIPSTITEVIFGDSVQSIPNNLLYNHTGLTSITIPSSVTSIGSYSFSGCSSVQNVNINVIDISASNYTVNIALNNYFSDKVWTYYYNGAPLTEIPEETTSIGDYALANYMGLTSITIPSSVTSIGSSAFSGCSGLTYIDIPTSVTSIGSSAFYGCSGLTYIDIPTSVTSIADYAFYGCSGLTSITIPSSVTSIGASAFRNCTPSYVKFEGKNPPTLGSYAFGTTSGNQPDVDNVIVNGWEKYKESYSTSSAVFFPLSEITFTSTPTTESYKAAVTAVDKSNVKSVLFFCDGLDEVLDEDVIKNGMNPNCIYYVKEGCGITGDNIVSIGSEVKADKIVLADGYSYDNLAPVDVKTVQYVHNPSVWADGKAGWETLCLPFAPTKISASESGYLSPITLGASGNFWMRKYVGASSSSVFFSSTMDGVMEAQTPYLVAFPGKSMGTGYLEGQTITFEANNVTLPVTSAPEPQQKNAFTLKATYDTTADTQSGYELNEEGDSFVEATTVGTHPFRAYFLGDENSADVRSLKISFGKFNEETGIFEVEGEENTTRQLCKGTYDLSGRRTEANHKGIYIKNGKKVVKL